jgi:hypothetical protein
MTPEWLRDLIVMGIFVGCGLLYNISRVLEKILDELREIKRAVRVNSL